MQQPKPQHRVDATSKKFNELQMRLAQEPMTASAFLELWKHYDQDASRYLEPHEIRVFIKDLMTSSSVFNNSRHIKKSVIVERELMELVSEFMDKFDANKDGKISIQEFTAALPIEECFCTLFRQEIPGGKGQDYMKIWKKFDRDLSGYIEQDELKDFLGAILKTANSERVVPEKKLDEYAKIVMVLFDIDNDKRLAFGELVRLLPSQENFVHLALKEAINLEFVDQSGIEKILDHYDKDHNGTLEEAELWNLVVDLIEASVKQSQRTKGHYVYTAKDVESVHEGLLNGCDIDGNGKIDRRELSIILSAMNNFGLSGLFARRHSKL